tara:strand:+ start:780 stop:986 length:207 start_codon:yes stop_codon:yes gene_type:complete
MYTKEDLKKDIDDLTIETQKLKQSMRINKVINLIAKLHKENYSNEVIQYWQKVYTHLRTKQIMKNYGA